LTRSFRELETFEISQVKRYFRETDLINKTKDINLSNNPRKNHHKFDQLNKEKYIPIHRRKEYMMKTFSLGKTDDYRGINKVKEEKSFSQGKLKEKDDNYKNFSDYMEKTNVSRIAHGNIRESIKSNIKDLIQKINSEFDVVKFNKSDMNTNYLEQTTVAYSPLTIFNRFNKSETSKFKQSLTDKVNSMTVVHPVAKEKALININYKYTAQEENKFTLPLLDHFNLTSHTNQSVSAIHNSSHSLYNKDRDNYGTWMNTVNYKDFLRPTKKNINRKKEKEFLKNMNETSDYMSIIKPDNYNSHKHKNSIYFEESDPSRLRSLGGKS
jgi:hypothetical protein